ncbi:MAG TPA: ImmA/IrrE family metallo-endopeptidase [Symbiobacteriaceae bacterium]|nr:ImmA/IrrE family metallo-endopeptidase [Symbiobacteriaceae bacterium]
MALIAATNQATPEEMAARLIRWANLYPPIDVERAARLLGVDIVDLELSSGVGGLLVKEAPRRWLIIVNSRLTDPAERRFTIAHELGHWTLHRPLIRRDSTEVSNRRMEHEAHRFAQALLLPPDEVEEDVIHGCLDSIPGRYKVPMAVVATVLRRWGYAYWHRHEWESNS